MSLIKVVALVSRKYTLITLPLISWCQFVSGQSSVAVTSLTVLFSTFVQVTFLNLMALLKQRGGVAHIRVGGNTQETATIVDSIPGGKVLTKANGNTSNPVSYRQSL